jgi:hypothetical protein
MGFKPTENKRDSSSSIKIYGAWTEAIISDFVELTNQDSAACTATPAGSGARRLEPYFRGHAIPHWLASSWVHTHQDSAYIEGFLGASSRRYVVVMDSATKLDCTEGNDQSFSCVRVIALGSQGEVHEVTRL